jgi:hypothetical protein
VLKSHSLVKLAICLGLASLSVQSDAGIITYLVTTQETTTDASSQVASTSGGNKRTEDDDEGTGTSSSAAVVRGDESRQSYITGTSINYTAVEFSSASIAESSANASINVDNQGSSIRAQLAGSASSSRIEDVVRVETVRTTDRPDGTSEIIITRETQPYESRTEAFSSSKLRIEALEDGVLSSMANDFIINARISENSMIGDSGRNTSTLGFDGRNLSVSGIKRNLGTGEKTLIDGRQAASERPVRTPDGEFELPAYSYALSGTFEDFLAVNANVRSTLTYQRNNDGGTITKYEANQTYFVNVIVGEGASQANPFMPSFSDTENGTYKFTDGLSGGWFDPIVYENYFFSMDSTNTFFTDILSFPTGFGDEFGLFAFDEMNNIFDLNTFAFNESVSLEALLSNIGITGFLVTGIDNSDDTHQFPIQLAFSSATASFTMQGIEDAVSFLDSFNNDNVNAVSAPWSAGMIGFGLLVLLTRKNKFYV